MGLTLDYQEGQTPIDDDEKNELLIRTISTRSELDEFEQLGIEDAVAWLNKRRIPLHTMLTESFVKELHERMFGKIWKWAGTFRTSNKNIGVDKYLIGVELKGLLDDCCYWIDNKTFPPDEIAIRASHRMVLIHPFANGNGRHSRLYADALIHNGFGGNYFTWGGKSLIKEGEARSRYLHALRCADMTDYKPLLAFARL
ncbi:MAG: mobile mystery protein B [Ignavibacteriales bacterium]|nr:mobile mystery protein B [Ignavibacteriales bacterium]